MKTIKFLKNVLLSGLALIAMTVMLGCERTQTENPDPLAQENLVLDSQWDHVQILTQVNDLPFEDLSQEEIDGLLFMREEEKLARDTYIRLYDLFGLRNFSNISKSEQAHMDAILYLLNKYEIEDPVGDNEIGVFKNEELQQLFNELMEMGHDSKIDALKVGALIEETDIIDIQYELDNTVDNQDISFVYGNLIRASGFHLKSFVAVLGFNGVQYEPSLLDEETYLEIIGD
jgi:hypothetical protein